MTPPPLWFCAVRWRGPRGGGGEGPKGEEEEEEEEEEEGVRGARSNLAPSGLPPLVGGRPRGSPGAPQAGAARGRRARAGGGWLEVEAGVGRPEVPDLARS
ncbi:unnamed protein product [Prorocentrum cordatum]|uniref:Uncharacterized protein n=1 Tax=Prorocentrum cordatum TaxID=2364126 RepID=A0ABN9XP79_9DINO|nr:unnamed protein product [Polarella glacialis]